MSDILLAFNGVITKVTPTGLDAIVSLDEPVEGREFAVIRFNTEGRVNTEGRDHLVDDQNHIRLGIGVRGTGHPSGQAIKAKTIEKISDPALHP